MRVITTGFICLFLSSAFATASPLSPDIFEFRYLRTEASKFETNPIKNVEVDNDAFEIKGILGKQDIGDSFVLYKARYEVRQFELSENPGDNGIADMHVLSFGAQFIIPGQQWTHLFYIEPGIYSDMKDIDADDFGLAGHYIANYSSGGDWSYIMGIGAGREFGEPTAFPILGAVYKPTEALNLELTVPSAKVSYLFNKSWMFYSHIKPMGSQWNLNNDTPLPITDFQGPNDSVYFVATGYEAVVGIEAKVSKSFWAGIQLGRLMNRTYEYKDDNDFSAKLDVQDTTIAAFSIKMRH